MEKDNDTVHIGQRFYDSIFWLFVLGNLVTLVTFDIWGLLDLKYLQ